jgi:hypothetical protein
VHVVQRLDQIGPRAWALAGFVADTPGVEVTWGAHSVLARGVSDQAWTYALSLGQGGEREILASLGPRDRYFAALDSALARHVQGWLGPASHASEGVTLAWLGRAAPPIDLAAGYRQRALWPAEAAQVDAAWAHRGPGTAELLTRLVRRGPCVGTEDAQRALVAWGVVLDDRAIGACAVEPGHHGLGLHVAQVARLTALCHARGWPAFQHVYPAHAASWARRGWTVVADVTWLVSVG